MPFALPDPAPASCPLCGQPSGCAMQAGLPAQDCWCLQHPALPAAAAARLQQAAPGQCLCPACLALSAATPPHP